MYDILFTRGDIKAIITTLPETDKQPGIYDVIFKFNYKPVDPDRVFFRALFREVHPTL